MKVLFLGNSSEVYGDISEDDRRASMVSDALEAELGEPVDVQVRTIWPSSRLPAAIDKWMTEFQPDIVYLNVIAFWFNYESVPLKFERMFGRAGKPFKSAGIKAAQIPWLGHTRVFHWSRARIQSAIGGATFFEPGEVVKVISDCVRVVVRHEESLLVVKDHARTTATARASGHWHGRRNGDCASTAHSRVSLANCTWTTLARRSLAT
jgi:hypothetical protein